LDHSATTPVHPEVFAKMEPFFTRKFGNPSSIHSVGRAVKIPLEDARIQVAEGLHTQPPRIVFTSGGTESDYLAVVGTALANQDKGKHLIITEIEHAAVLSAVEFLKSFGFTATVLPVDKHGLIDIEQLKAAIQEDTILISVMYVNNEIGTIQPIEKIGEIAREKGVIFHTDAVQAFPILDIDLEKLPVDLLTISSHKINGPKGIGALYIRNGTKINPLIGGSQERARRGGTENVPGIIGFGEAVRVLTAGKEEKYKLFSDYKQLMINFWENSLGRESFVVNGHPSSSVPSILNVSFLGVNSQTMIMALDLKGIAISGGSACAAGAVEISRVIKALNVSEEISSSAVRLSFGLGTTREQVEKAAKEIAHVVTSRLPKGNKMA